VFLPLISIAGVTGVFFRALAVTVAVALLTSLALALTWTPTLSHYLLRRRAVGQTSTSAPDLQVRPVSEAEFGEAGRSAPQQPPAPHPEGRFFGRLLRVYERALRFALAHPVILSLFVVALIGASYFTYQALGSDLLPEMDEGGFILDYLMPAGSSLAETDRVLTQVDAILHSTPEVENTSRRTGLQLGLAQVTEANRGDFTVKLRRDRSRSVDEVVSEVRGKVTERFPMLDVEFPQLLQDMIGDLIDAPEPIEVKLFAQDPALLREWAPKLGDKLKAKKNLGIVDVLNGIENTISGPAISFKVDPVVAARAGFSTEEVELDASAIIQGEPAPTPVVTNDRPYTIRVRYPESARASIDSIRNTLLISANGKTATLGSLASVIEMPGQTEIRRDNLQRSVAVTARLEGLDLGSGIAEVKKSVAELNMPPAIRVEYGGSYLEQQRSFRGLLMVLVLAVILVFTVLLFEFGGFAAPVAILTSALLSTSGVFVALLITRTTFNISSFMGLIMVVGIVAKNGILLLDADQRFRAEGANPFDAMVQAGERRLRPILMTALATVAGMLPLALAIGAGSQMLQPLAIAVIGGVLASMVLSLIVTPAVHYVMTRRGE
jgi:multidrug efflux pump subunit AcrB